MFTREDHRHFAVACLRFAAEAKGDRERRIFLKMADAWTRIALVRNDMTVQFAADTNGAKQQIHS